MDNPESIPETGAVFTFGRSKFADDIPSCFWLKNDRVNSISCGDEHTALVTEAGKVYVFGSNDWGQLGLGHSHTVTKPTCVKFFKMHRAKLVACGRNHTLVYTTDNKLFTFGNNGDSQLGVETNQNSNVPVEVDVSKYNPIQQIDAGADFSMALTEGGELLVWGSNSEGQLGLGVDVNEVNVPTLLHISEKIVSVSCGYYHTAIVTASGSLLAFGEDENDKLGEREDVDSTLPSKVVLENGVKVLKAACGGAYTAFISVDGQLYTFGDGAHGQLGHGAEVLNTAKPLLVERLKQHKVKNLSCGENFTAVITDKGKLYTFGDGRHGKLALGEENFTNQFTPFCCKKFTQYELSTASCGGCHLIVLGKFSNKTSSASDSEEENPLLTMLNETTSGPGKNRNILHILENERVNGDLSLEEVGTKSANVSLSRSLSAREKRRNRRDNSLSMSLTPLKTLKHHELMEAAKSLPKLPVINSTKLENNELGRVGDNKKANLPEDDLTSEISTFNKVHILKQVEDIPIWSPVRPKKPEENIDNKMKEKENGENKKPTLQKTDVEIVAEEPSEEEDSEEEVDEDVNGQEEDDEAEEDDESVEEEEKKHVEYGTEDEDGQSVEVIGNSSPNKKEELEDAVQKSNEPLPSKVPLKKSIKFWNHKKNGEDKAKVSKNGKDEIETGVKQTKDENVGSVVQEDESKKNAPSDPTSTSEDANQDSTMQATTESSANPAATTKKQKSKFCAIL